MSEDKDKKIKEKKPLTPEQKMLAGYQRKLTFEAIVKSCVFGLAAGFLLMILISIISFATKFNALWISLSVWAVASVGCSLLLYFTVFKTTAQKTASRMDEMGLDERVVTMLQLQGTDSVIAQKQRQDTQSVLSNVTPKKLKFGGFKLFIIFASIIAAIAVAAILMTTFSTVQAKRAEAEAAAAAAAEQEEPKSEEDRIIEEMLEALRQEIADAKIKESLRDRLNGMVDDLEMSLRPTDTLEIKIAKISDTAQRIHKLLQEALQATTIPEELQTHDTTKKLGDALVSGDIKKVEQAFDDMYNSIEPLAVAQKYEQLQQTAYDILDSIKDADEKDEELAKVLEDLAQAFLDAIKLPPPPPEGDGDEEKGGDEIDQAVQDAIEDAKDAMQGILPNLPSKDEIENTDDALSDIFQDAMSQLGQDSSSDDDKDDDKDEDKDKDKEQAGPARPGADGDIVYDSVIDGQTPYDTVYQEYRDKALQLLASGDLSDEQRDVIEKYLELLDLLEGQK